MERETRLKDAGEGFLMKKSIHVFCHVSDEFAPFLATTIASICWNTKSFVEFHVIDFSISNFRKKCLEMLKEKFQNFSLEYISFGNNKAFDKKYINGLNYNFAGISVEHMCMSAFVSFLRPDIDKLIFMDTDIIAMDDIEKIYDIDLNGYIIAASPDLGVERSHIIHLGLEEHTYFNAGILVIDAGRWRLENMTDKYIETSNNSKIKFGDQDILNLMFVNNNYLQMPIEYNYQGYERNADNIYMSGLSDEDLDHAKRNIIMRHYCVNKPWLFVKNDKGQPMKNIHDFWFFANMTPFVKGMERIFAANIVNATYNDLSNVILSQGIYRKIKTFIKRAIKKVFRLFCTKA